MKKRILVSWIGHTDLSLMAEDVGGETAKLVTKRITWTKISESSPIKAILDHESFDHIHLLSNYGEELDSAYTKWIGRPVTIHPFEVPNPSDYDRIFHVTKEVLDKISVRYGKESWELSMNLSTGTHTMVAILLLLGSTHYKATFFTCYKDRPSIVTLPFELDLFLREQLDQSWTLLPFKSPSDVPGFEDITGSDGSLLRATHRARLAATHGVNVLLLGESGVGKELFAKAIHKASSRKGKFVPVNCAAIPPQLFEAELFGSKKGGYTGADRDRPGFFKEADQGTLFLDELGELQPDHQSKLLRAVQSSAAPTLLELERVGDPGNPFKVDVQIVCATNRNLMARDVEDPFRHDLYYRLASFPILIPSLRERRSDIPLLADKLIQEINDSFKKSHIPF